MIRTLHPCLLATALDAVRRWDDRDHPYVAPLLTGDALAVWTCPEIPYEGHDNRGSTSLIRALERHGNLCSDWGLEIDAKDCFWLSAKLRGGSLQVIDRCHLKAAGPYEVWPL